MEGITDIKNQARFLAKEAVGDLAIVNKVKGTLVVIMTDETRKEINPKDWAALVGPKIRKVIPGWEVTKEVNGLMIFELKYKREERHD